MSAKQRDFEDPTLGRESHGAGAGAILTSTLLAAAVGAGVALLLAPDSGRNIRKRIRKRIDDMEIGPRAKALKGRFTEEASSRIEELTDRLEDLQEELEDRLVGPRRSTGRDATIGALSTLIGAGIALLLAPEAGADTREKLSQRLRTFRDDMSARWHPHRAEESGTAAGGNGETDRARAGGRSAQEAVREN